MTLSTTSPRVTYAGDGSSTSFAFAFKVFASTDLKVYLRDTTTLLDTLQALTTNYTVSGTLPGTGSVVFGVAPTASQRVVIVRDPATSQDLDLFANGAFAAENVEAELDKVVGFVQALEEQVGRSLLLPVGSALVNLALPEPSLATAGMAMVINATGDGFDLTANLDPLVPVSAFMATVLDDTTAAAARATLGVPVISTYMATVLDDIAASAARVTLGVKSVRKTGIVYDPASLTNGSETESADINVPGVALGDSVIVFPPYDLQGIACWAYVKSSQNIRIRLRNGTGGTIDLASSAFWEVWVWTGGQA